MKLTSRFGDAFEFASKVHREDTKKSTEVPYIAHLLEVSGLVLSYGGNEDEAIAALLHDTVEDHSDIVTFETIGKRFGGRVAAIVESCSDTSVFPKPPWKQRKEKYIAHVRHANESVVMVSAADKLSNARTVMKDYRQVGDEVWHRFNAGKEDQLWYYREVTAALTEAAGEGRARPLVEELQRAAAELQSVCGGTSKPVESMRARLDGCVVRPVAAPEAAVGVDVGEDYLDIAVLRVKSLELKHHRIALRAIEGDSLRIVRERLVACCPDANSRWLALIDSPRWPLDLDCSSRGVLARDPVPAGRILDRALRDVLRSSAAGAAIQLSMFPTPRFEYFQQCAKAPGCKPHLRSIYYQLFENGSAYPASEDAGRPARIAGGNFTRFMLAGFLTFRAWQDLGVETLEAYPNLQYRLSSARRMPAKREGKAAVAERIAITKLLRQSLGIGLSDPARTLDQADAEILALSAAIAAKEGKLAALEHPAEGKFLITF